MIIVTEPQFRISGRLRVAAGPARPGDRDGGPARRPGLTRILSEAALPCQGLSGRGPGGLSTVTVIMIIEPSHWHYLDS